jgi:uncharacterized membrane protein YesL
MNAVIKLLYSFWLVFGLVMAGLVPAIHVFLFAVKSWITGSRRFAAAR